LGGYFELYAIAGLRRWRRKSLRFQKEIQRINEWLVHIPTLAQENYALAVEFAECPQMVKGYGDTHQRGKECFDAVMKVLPKLRLLDEAAPRLKKLREAALADDTGQKLAEALRELAA
jgi:indolepyruvate ferredoxin oxidoreductase beta subunit